MALKSVELETPKTKRTISLRWLMILGFGGMVALSVGGVLTMSVMANFQNTFSLLNEQTLQKIGSMERAIKTEMAQAEYAVDGLVKLHQDGTLDLRDAESAGRALQTSLRSLQIIEALSITSTTGQVVGYQRAPNGDITNLPAGSYGHDGKMIALPDGNAADSHNWTSGILVDNQLSHRLIKNVVFNGQIVAQIEANIDGYSINRMISNLATDDKTTAFVLDNEGKLIAHSARPSLFREKPQYDTADFPALGMMQFSGADKLPAFQENGVPQDRYTVLRTRNGSDGSGGQNNYFYITVPLKVFSSEPYTVGAYMLSSDINDELRRAGFTVFVGIAALLLTLLAAVLLSHRLSKPMRRIAETTSKFSRLELDGFEPLPKSRVRELDTQANVINSMHTALSQFSKYVPQKLVQRILESGSEVTRPVERPVTVMFTDIANFTAGSENLDAAEITALLNEHFDLISSQVAKSNGTVDKYLGDGVMAFWGAPETDEDHAAHAIEAAIAIKRNFEAHCEDRRKAGVPGLQLRIGIHSGRAIVGNIGGDDRTNYTVIGHTVNVANRIEQIGKDFLESNDAIVTVSHECFSAAGEPQNFATAGAHMVRGSSKPVSLFIHQSDRSGDNVIDIRNTAT
ncbi:MAG: adenylate/guanylate cyclase domain-containing protein [Rhizobiaceae bacterium]